MKKIILISLILLFLVGCSSNEITDEVTEEISNCPRGLVNDEYPGACGSYIDIDENQICDYSE